MVKWKEFIHFGNACSKFSNFHVIVFPLVLSTRCLSNPATVHLGPRSVKASGVTLSRGVGRGVRRETARGIEWGALPSPCTTRTLQDVVPKLRDLSRFHFYLSLTRTDSIRMLYSIKSIPGDARLSFKLNARKKKKFSKLFEVSFFKFCSLLLVKEGLISWKERKEKNNKGRNSFE